LTSTSRSFCFQKTEEHGNLAQNISEDHVD
jgi:hypothetical protein